MSAAHEPVKIASLIGGQWVNGTGADIASENPAIEGQIVAAGNAATPADVDAAFAAARAAAHGWASTPMHARGLVLSRAAAIIVNPANKLESLTLGQIQAIFQGDVDDWAVIGGTELTPPAGPTAPR